MRVGIVGANLVGTIVVDGTIVGNVVGENGGKENVQFENAPKTKMKANLRNTMAMSTSDPDSQRVCWL